MRAGVVDVRRDASTPIEDLASRELRHGQLSRPHFAPEGAPRLRAVCLAGPQHLVHREVAHNVESAADMVRVRVARRQHRDALNPGGL